MPIRKTGTSSRQSAFAVPGRQRARQAGERADQRASRDVHSLILPPGGRRSRATSSPQTDMPETGICQARLIRIGLRRNDGLRQARAPHHDAVNPNISHRMTGLKPRARRPSIARRGAIGGGSAAMTDRRRVAIIGLGMAVRPHARSLVDLRDRVEVAYAFSRSDQRRRAFSEQFDFPLTGDLTRILADPSIEAVLILTPPNSHLELVERFAAAGKHILLEKPLERSTERALRLVEAAETARVTPRRRAPIPLPRGLEPSARPDRGRRARRSRRGPRDLPLVAAAKLLRRAGPRHPRARRRRRADHPGDPHPRPDAEPRRAGRRSRGDRRHDQAAPHGDRGFRGRRPALRERRARRPDGDDRGLSRHARADRTDRYEGHRRRSLPALSPCTTRTAGRKTSASSRAPAAAPIPWIFRTMRIAR